MGEDEESGYRKEGEGDPQISTGQITVPVTHMGSNGRRVEILGGETVQMNSIFDVLSLRHLWDTRVRMSGEQMAPRVGLSEEMKMEVWESLAPVQGLELWLWVRLPRSV